ncbi:site-specific integrase [Bacteroidales bacterium OttesenSCG-928-M06]|nr:site-specific integrase [Bacteroidales bacterium OttesenSCG-928-M06]
MPKFFTYIKKDYISKTGHTPLYVRYNYDRTKRTLIATGYSIKYDHWDEKKKCVKRACPEYEEIEVTLNKINLRLSNILNYANENEIEPTVDFVLKELATEREYEQKQARLDLFAMLDKYIEEKAPFVSKDQVKDYKSLRKHLNAFKVYSSQPITFRNLNLKFYNEFMDYLFYKAIKPDGGIGLVTNSAGKVVRMLKGFVNYQMAKGTIPTIDLKCFKVVEEETDAIYLSENELKKVYELNLSDDKELEEIRDIFIVGCYTGLRYSDLSTLNPEHIDLTNEVINLKQRKVHKAVVIPMIDYVPIILKKYNYALPKVSSYKFNERVKELGERIKLNQKVEIVRKKGNARVVDVYKKYELISSHTCRRSFCTNMYLSGFPAEELMRISGHKSPAAFMRYIKVDNMQAANRLKALRNSLNK